MQGGTKKLYANVIRARTTPLELVLEFGTFLPLTEDEAKAGVPENFEYDAEIIINLQQLPSVSESLQDILRRVNVAKATQNAGLPVAAVAVNKK